jgi:hypothetical protein
MGKSDPTRPQGDFGVTLPKKVGPTPLSIFFSTPWSSSRCTGDMNLGSVPRDPNSCARRGNMRCAAWDTARPRVRQQRHLPKVYKIPVRGRVSHSTQLPHLTQHVSNPHRAHPTPGPHGLQLLGVYLPHPTTSPMGRVLSLEFI